MEIKNKRVNKIKDNVEKTFQEKNCSNKNMIYEEYENDLRKKEIDNLLNKIISAQVNLKKSIENSYICLICKLKFKDETSYEIHNSIHL